MTDLQRFAQIATQLHEEEPEVPVIPFHARNTLHFQEHAYYLCSCGKGFTDITTKRSHQAWCRTHSARESERNPSNQRLMGA
jgi:hypothetical protein